MLEAVQCFVKQKHGVRVIDVDESFGLLDVYFEVASAVEEGVFAVNLDDAKIVGSANG